MLGLAIDCVGIFVAIVYLLTIFYLNSMSELEYKKWEISTLTTSDFTAEMTITESMWNELNRILGRIEDPVVPNASPMYHVVQRPIVGLSQHIEKEILIKLNALPKIIHEDKNLKIAHISFSYANREVIDLLMKRGSLITKGYYDKLNKSNQAIEQSVKANKDEL